MFAFTCNQNNAHAFIWNVSPQNKKDHLQLYGASSRCIFMLHLPYLSLFHVALSWCIFIISKNKELYPKTKSFVFVR